MRYIGCKTSLLNNIKEIIDENVPTEANSFCDIFSGTATVARHFKQFYETYSNDLLYFSYVLQKGTVENDEYPKFDNLKKITGDNPIKYFNSKETADMESLPKEKRFFQNNYSPTGGRMYMNDDNALRVDYSRNMIEDWYNNDLITENEYFYLIACVVEGIPFISNISGTYGAYRKDWDIRSYKKFELCELDVISNGKNNKAYNCDGVELLKHISGDILYIDPPYNGRQYLPNYHVLETAAKYDFPKIKGVTGLRQYDEQKSKFCQKTKVISAFEQLMENAEFRYIIMSYSTDGLMSVNDIESIMKRYGKKETFRLYEIPYRRFKSRNATKTSQLKELLIYVEK